MFRLILLSALIYMLFRMIKPLFFPAARPKNPHVKQNRPKEDIQKKLSDKIEDADFEELE